MENTNNPRAGETFSLIRETANKEMSAPVAGEAPSIGADKTFQDYLTTALVEAKTTGVPSTATLEKLIGAADRYTSHAVEAEGEKHATIIAQLTRERDELARVNRFMAEECDARGVSLAGLAGVSAATAPVSESRQAELDPSDLTITSWPERTGGMQVSKMCGVRILHKPTGLYVEENADRSQPRNKAVAMERLRSLVATKPAALPAEAVRAQGDAEREAEAYAEPLPTSAPDFFADVAPVLRAHLGWAPGDPDPLAQDEAAQRARLNADDSSQIDRLRRIIAYAYQIAGAHDAPDRILDVLRYPESATDEQIGAMLPYWPEATGLPAQGDSNSANYLTMVFDMRHPQADRVREFLREALWARSCYSDAMSERDSARADLAAVQKGELVAWMQSKEDSDPACDPAAKLLTMTDAWKRKLIAEGGTSAAYANEHDVPLYSGSSPTSAIGARAEELPSLPTNEELDELYQRHFGHPADFGADVLSRWGGWQPGLLGQGGVLESALRQLNGKFQLGESVRKTKGSQWSGKVVGRYSTKLTPEGYAVESASERGSVQIYPAFALERVNATKVEPEGEA